MKKSKLLIEDRHEVFYAKDVELEVRDSEILYIKESIEAQYLKLAGSNVVKIEIDNLQRVGYVSKVTEEGIYFQLLN